MRWPYTALRNRFTAEVVLDWFGQEQCKLWQEQGLSDREADHVAILLGTMPYEIWRGYLEAGLDYKEPHAVV